MEILETIKKYREWLIVILAGLSLAFAPYRADAHANDLTFLTGKVNSVEASVQSLVRLQCQTSDVRSLRLAGVSCP